MRVSFVLFLTVVTLSCCSAAREPRKLNLRPSGSESTKYVQCKGYSCPTITECTAPHELFMPSTSKYGNCCGECRCKCGVCESRNEEGTCSPLMVKCKELSSCPYGQQLVKNNYTHGPCCDKCVDKSKLCTNAWCYTVPKVGAGEWLYKPQSSDEGDCCGEVRHTCVDEVAQYPRQESKYPREEAQPKYPREESKYPREESKYPREEHEEKSKYPREEHEEKSKYPREEHEEKSKYPRKEKSKYPRKDKHDDYDRKDKHDDYDRKSEYSNDYDDKSEYSRDSEYSHKSKHHDDYEEESNDGYNRKSKYDDYGRKSKHHNDYEEESNDGYDRKPKHNDYEEESNDGYNRKPKHKDYEEESNDGYDRKPKHNDYEEESNDGYEHKSKHHKKSKCKDDDSCSYPRRGSYGRESECEYRKEHMSKKGYKNHEILTVYEQCMNVDQFLPFEEFLRECGVCEQRSLTTFLCEATVVCRNVTCLPQEVLVAANLTVGPCCPYCRLKPIHTAKCARSCNTSTVNCTVVNATQLPCSTGYELYTPTIYRRDERECCGVCRAMCPPCEVRNMHGKCVPRNCSFLKSCPVSQYLVRGNRSDPLRCCDSCVSCTTVPNPMTVCPGDEVLVLDKTSENPVRSCYGVCSCNECEHKIHRCRCGETFLPAHDGLRCCDQCDKAPNCHGIRQLDPVCGLDELLVPASPKNGICQKQCCQVEHLRPCHKHCPHGEYGVMKGHHCVCKSLSFCPKHEFVISVGGMCKCAPNNKCKDKKPECHPLDKECHTRKKSSYGHKSEYSDTKDDYEESYGHKSKKNDYEDEDDYGHKSKKNDYEDEESYGHKSKKNDYEDEDEDDYGHKSKKNDYEDKDDYGHKSKKNDYEEDDYGHKSKKKNDYEDDYGKKSKNDYEEDSYGSKKDDYKPKKSYDREKWDEDDYGTKSHKRGRKTYDDEEQRDY